MLIPQFSIRWLLKVTAGCAVVFSVFGLAIRGSGWAQGVSIGVVALLVLLLVYALLFTALWIFGVLSAPLRGRMVGGGRSPFLYETSGLPPKAPGGPSEEETPATPTILE